MTGACIKFVNKVWRCRGETLVSAMIYPHSGAAGGEEQKRFGKEVYDVALEEREQGMHLKC